MTDPRIPFAIMEQAARWHAAQDADDMDWDAFTAWLEADPRHRAAMDDLAIIDDAVTGQRAEVADLLPSEAAPAVRRRFGWGVAGGGAIAAALAIAVGLPRAAHDRSWTSTTTPMEVSLPDGVRTILAPHSRLTAAGGDTTQLALAGAAYFDVAHRPDRTLNITAGDLSVRDIGTRFEIATAEAGTRIAVAEGQVRVGSPRMTQDVTLAAGRTLFANGEAVTLGRAVPDDVASWRRGQLVFDAMPLALVAAEISRYSGRPVTVDPQIADRPFSGVLRIGDGASLGKDVAALADVAIRDGDAGQRLEPRRR